MSIPVIIKSCPRDIKVNHVHSFLNKTLKLKSVCNIYRDIEKCKKIWIILNSQKEAEFLIKGKHFLNKRRVKFSFDPLHLKKMYTQKIRQEFRLYINNIDPSIEGEDLYKVFSKFGEVESVFLKKIEYEKNYPQEDTIIIFCFVCFKNKQGFTNASQNQLYIEKKHAIKFFADLDDSRSFNTKNFGHLENRTRVNQNTYMYRPE